MDDQKRSDLWNHLVSENVTILGKTEEYFSKATPGGIVISLLDGFFKEWPMNEPDVSERFDRSEFLGYIESHGWTWELWNYKIGTFYPSPIEPLHTD